MKIRAVIVDDEPLARKRIRMLAAEDPLVEIVAECASGLETLAVIGRDRPDVLFLDVQMPEMDGFQLLEQMPREHLPAVIFTTAFDKHAVRAFETHALDYLIKPVQSDRFKAAVARAREYMTNHHASSAARGLLEALSARKISAEMRYLTRITVKTDDRVIVIKAVDIDSIESAGNYVAVNTGKESHILRETLNALQTQLDPEKFLRISRSAIVNLDRVKELQPMFKGEHIIVLQNGKQLTMSRGLLREVEEALKFG